MRSTHNEVNNNDNIFISQITDNYEYNINITINDIVYNYTGKVLGYNEVITNNNNNEHYYKKKDIYYKLDSDKGYILTNKKDIYNIIDYDYLDINNIKEYIKLSTREDNIYKVKVSDINLSNTKEDYITIKIDNINNTYKKDNESKSLAFNDISKDPIIIKRPPKKPKKPLGDFDDLM